MTEQTVDVLVIGGGVVGAGAALDAASRGLSVALVEARDWASGTSSRSSKLVHGGIRYLEQMDFKLVHEALRERGNLLQNLAPHIVKPVPFLYPLQSRFIERGYVGAGMTLYDALSGRKSGVPRHRYLNSKSLVQEMPGLASGKFVGGMCYFDAQVDDARLVITLVRTAADLGVMAMSRAAVVDVVETDANDNVVLIRDQELGDEFVVTARHVVNATGVWTEESEKLFKKQSGISVTMSKGVHLLVPRDKIDLELGLLLRTEKSVLFVIPWDKQWLIGTTDTAWELDKSNPAATNSDIDYILQHLNEVVSIPLTRDDVVGVYSGLRPLVSGKASATAKLSREHVVGVPRPGVALIAGGKLTTYRVMAEDVVQAALASKGTVTEDSNTAELPLVGAKGFHAALSVTRDELQARNIKSMFAERLVNRYGSLASEVIDLIDEFPDLGELLHGTSDMLKAEIAYAVLAEDARHLEDVMVRRSRLSIEHSEAGKSCVHQVSEIMAKILGWNERQLASEREQYFQLADLEQEASNLPTDQEANEVLSRTTNHLPQFANARIVGELS